MDYLEGLRTEYDLLGYNPDEADQILTDAGYTKDGEGFWADESGDRISCEVIGITQLADLGPVIAEILRQSGIDASYEQPADFGDRYKRRNLSMWHCSDTVDHSPVTSIVHWLYTQATARKIVVYMPIPNMTQS